MQVCACGQVMPKGAGWCEKCYVFWQSWWLRLLDSDKCTCADCRLQKRIIPVIDDLEAKRLH